MQDRPLFLRWALINVLFIVGAVSSAIAFESSAGHLSVATRVCAGLIAVVYLVMSGYCGKLMWRLDNIFEESKAWASDGLLRAREIQKITHDSEHVYFSVSMLQILGLLGTVTGFLIVMVGGFNKLGGTDQAAVRGLLQHVATGAATALLCTLVGILTSVILGIQHHLLMDSIERDATGTR